jgi:putative FmdB family regulatory protein
MPTYDYNCRTCGHRFEYFQSMSAEPLTKCPVAECAHEDPEQKGTGDVVRAIGGGAGLVFKGEGFYLTDYVRKGKSGGGESSSGSSGGDKPASSSGGSSTSDK